MAPLEEAVRRVRRRTERIPEVTLIVEGGLDVLAEGFRTDIELPLAELLDLEADGADGGAQLIIGDLEGLPAAAVRGVLYRHSGLPLRAATLPVRLMRRLAPDRAPPPLLILGVCESLLPRAAVGDLVLLEDHINWMGENPLVGPNDDSLGPRFPDMSEAYDPGLQEIVREEALAARIPLPGGVYVAVTGPQRPTPAEYRMLRWMGGDFVGNWVVPEVIVARHMRMPVLALLAVSRVCVPDSPSADPGGAGELRAATSAAASLTARLCVRLRGLPKGHT